MNKDIFKGHWKELKGKVKQQWAALTEDDLKLIEGKSEELSGLLQKRYGYDKDRAEKSIDEFIKKQDKDTRGTWGH